MTSRNLPRPGELDVLLSLFGPLRVRFCPLRPTPRQEAFLLLKEKEVFHGGAAGGGKSVAILMAALQYADVPGYDALILRPSLTELQLAGGLIELAHEWLGTTKARWSGETRTWRFPGAGRSGAGGATLTFGYLADISDVPRYAGDELLVPRLRRAHALRGGPLPSNVPGIAPAHGRSRRALSSRRHAAQGRSRARSLDE